MCWLLATASITRFGELLCLLEPFGLEASGQVYELRVKVAVKVVQMLDNREMESDFEMDSISVGDLVAMPGQYLQCSGVIPITAVARLLKRDIVVLSADGVFNVYPSGRASRFAIGFTTAAMDNAAAIGRLDIVQWLHAHENTVGCTTAAMDNAASRGEIAIVEWLHHHRSDGGTSRGVDQAAMNGHRHILAFFKYRREQVSEAAFRVCVSRGDLHTARWIAAHFRDVANIQTALEHAPSKGLTNAILRDAFLLELPNLTATT
ncbi:hypothetical protein PF008_g19881 [Phytophthora fragariae]|uniref:Uncharacterized protein n=1 Tax=Phytophthora fragariae TaxID=53985 RepID=A0A6G0R1D7_9STRA|nr:hypothetical protein PF008_g19881 [Phytophthora fragariae]